MGGPVAIHEAEKALEARPDAADHKIVKLKGLAGR
jgi:hypothetical protein